MRPLRTPTDATDYIDDDFAWRRKEVISLQQAIATASSPWKSTLLRAAVPLLYAHWEGFVKSSTEGLLHFVTGQRHAHGELETCYWVFGVRHELRLLNKAKMGPIGAEALEKVLASSSARTRFSAKTAVDTESNLSSKVFERIASSVGIDATPFATRWALIDKSLLDTRNHIAHGKSNVVDEPAFSSLAREVLQLMDEYRTELQNIVVLGKYKRGKPVTIAY